MISPHYPPSNLAAIHRTRLFAQHLPSFGWEPIILTVHEDYYEETLDDELAQLIPQHQRVEKVSAFPVSRPRLIGDIGLRGFFQLRKRAIQIIQSERIDFVYILIPSFYAALLGPLIHKKTKVPYGIDYIDPWVHDFAGSDQVFSRHWFSTQLSKLLEPIALSKVSLITGVSEGYFTPVFERNPKLINKVTTVSMPYGFESTDFDKVASFPDKEMLWPSTSVKFRFVYAGALLPKSLMLLQWIFEVCEKEPEWAKQFEFHFIGTMKKTNDGKISWIQDQALKNNIWDKVVFEYPSRLPYTDVIKHLQAANGIFVLGSTEPHYTPSKIFQAILSKNPVFSVLHQHSSAIGILEASKAGLVLPVTANMTEAKFKAEFFTKMSFFLNWVKHFNANQLDLDGINSFSAHSSTLFLVAALNTVLKSNSSNHEFKQD